MVKKTPNQKTMMYKMSWPSSSRRPKRRGTPSFRFRKEATLGSPLRHRRFCSLTRLLLLMAVCSIGKVESTTSSSSYMEAVFQLSWTSTLQTGLPIATSSSSGANQSTSSRGNQTTRDDALLDLLTMTLNANGSVVVVPKIPPRPSIARCATPTSTPPWW
jgi:hypothetical protein